MSVIPFDDEDEAHPDRQRHAIRPGRRGVDPRHLQGLSGGEGAARPALSGSTTCSPPLSKRRGGLQASGFGRELGHWGVEEYLETKQVFINLDEKPIGWY